MYIEKIEIQYFRSIYRETISGLKLLNILTGKNDAGKSNVLKALNLFFNNETDVLTPFDFSENFNFRRLKEVRSESIKGKQYIQIKVTFIRGNHSERTLPEKFTVAKKWLRTDIRPSAVTDDLEKRLSLEGKKYNERSKASLTSYLNKIHFIYIPAIKDNDTFQTVLLQLRDTIYNDKQLTDKSIEDAMHNLSDRISIASRELSDEFEIATSIKTVLSTPKSISELYQAIGVDTQYGQNTINLNKRGDGIRVRYLPSILHYISQHSSNMYIWGFEEPENSLEYNLALAMAKDFETKYSKKSMIFVTSHSPAFVTLDNSEVCQIYRCYQDNSSTKVIKLDKMGDSEYLSVELGYIKIQNEVFSLYNQKVQELTDVQAKCSKLTQELVEIKKPVLYTEGITDVIILNTAWQKLFGDTEKGFEIKSCNSLDESVGSSAGCNVLKELLCSARPDSPQPIIGLFDRDKGGIKAFSLNNNFNSIDDSWKTHKNQRAHGLLLPIPPGKELFAQYENLCIEFFFEKDDIDKRIDGKGLTLTPIPITQSFNGKAIDQRIPTEMHFHQIDSDSKRYFAEHIVPSLPETSFVHFRILFDRIKQVLDSMN